jgi:hypothetical protein
MSSISKSPAGLYLAQIRRFALFAACHLGQWLALAGSDGVNKPDGQGHRQEHREQVELQRPTRNAATPA